MLYCPEIAYVPLHGRRMFRLYRLNLDALHIISVRLPKIDHLKYRQNTTEEKARAKAGDAALLTGPVEYERLFIFSYYVILSYKDYGSRFVISTHLESAGNYLIHHLSNIYKAFIII